MRGRRRLAAGVVVMGLTVLLGCQGGGPIGGAAAGASSATVAPAAQLAVLPADGAVDLSPTAPISVAVTDGTLEQLTVTDGAGRVVVGSSAPATGTPGTAEPVVAAAPGSVPPSATAAGTSAWTPSDPLAYGATYTVSASARNADAAVTSAATTFSTVDPVQESTPSIGPLDGTKVGVGMPIRVYFDQPVADKAAVESHLTVTSSVPTDGRWTWIRDSEVHFRPSTYWPARTEVTLDAALHGVDMGEGVWGEKDRTVSFSIGAEHVSVVDAAAHTLTVRNGADVVQTYPMSAGNAENPTRNGAHVVLGKNADITMDSSTFGLAVDAPGGYRTDVEWATRISNNGEFVHAAPWSMGDQGYRNVSHGCINLSTERARWFFDFSQPGDVVEVVNSAGPTLSRADGDIYDWAIPWDQWVAGSALA